MFIRGQIVPFNQVPPKKPKRKDLDPDWSVDTERAVAKKQKAPVASRNVVTTEPRVSLQAHALHDAARPHTFTLDPGATRAQEAKDPLPEQHVVVPKEQPPVPSSPPSSEGSPLQCVVDEQPPSLEAMHMQVEDMLKQVLLLQERDQMHKSQIAMLHKMIEDMSASNERLCTIASLAEEAVAGFGDLP